MIFFEHWNSVFIYIWAHKVLANLGVIVLIYLLSKIVCFSRLLVKFPELNYQLKIKVCIDKWVCVCRGR